MHAFPFALIQRYPFHSLERSWIGDSGATTLADALRVNQSLKILKYVMIWSPHKATNKFRSMTCLAWVTFCSLFGLGRLVVVTIVTFLTVVNP